MKKIKIAFLLDKSNPWILKYFKKYYSKKFKDIKILWNSNRLKNFNIVFVLSNTKKIPLNKINHDSLNLVIHASHLPKGKGFAPIQWQILENKKEIIFSMFKIGEKIDSGPIVMKKKLKLSGFELHDEIRFLQAKIIFEMIKDFIKKYPKIKFFQQKGKSTFYRKRNIKDSELNISKSIISQFNKLRIVNNEKWPAYFIYKKKKYILKIYKHA